ISALKDFGIRVSRDQRSLKIVLTDDYLREELGDFNKRMLREKREWILAKPVGNLFWLGPLFRANRNACWACMGHRVRRNREAEMYVQAHGLSEEQISSPAVSESRLGIDWIALEVYKWILSATDFQDLITLDILKMKFQRHRILRLEDCSVCGHPV